MPAGQIQIRLLDSEAREVRRIETRRAGAAGGTGLPEERGGKIRIRLLAHAGVGALQAELAELARVALRLVNDKCAVAQIFGLIELVLLLLCQVDLQDS